MNCTDKLHTYRYVKFKLTISSVQSMAKYKQREREAKKCKKNSAKRPTMIGRVLPRLEKTRGTMHTNVPTHFTKVLSVRHAAIRSCARVDESLCAHRHMTANI